MGRSGRERAIATSIRLAAAVQARGRDLDLVVLPDDRHRVRSPNALYLGPAGQHLLQGLGVDLPADFEPPARRRCRRGIPPHGVPLMRRRLALVPTRFHHHPDRGRDRLRGGWANAVMDTLPDDPAGTNQPVTLGFTLLQHGDARRLGRRADRADQRRDRPADRRQCHAEWPDRALGADVCPAEGSWSYQVAHQDLEIIVMGAQPIRVGGAQSATTVQGHRHVAGAAGGGRLPGPAGHGRSGRRRWWSSAARGRTRSGRSACTSLAETRARPGPGRGGPRHATANAGSAVAVATDQAAGSYSRP